MFPEPVPKKKEVTFDKKPPDAIVIDSHHPPISLTDFPACWDLLSKDSYHGLSEEYKVKSISKISIVSKILLIEKNWFD